MERKFYVKLAVVLRAASYRGQEAAKTALVNARDLRRHHQWTRLPRQWQGSSVPILYTTARDRISGVAEVLMVTARSPVWVRDGGVPAPAPIFIGTPMRRPGDSGPSFA